MIIDPFPHSIQSLNFFLSQKVGKRKDTGQAVSKDIFLTLVLLNNREGRNSSLPSQFTRLVGKNYPIKGSSYFSYSNMHGPLGDPADDHA